MRCQGLRKRKRLCERIRVKTEGHDILALFLRRLPPFVTSDVKKPSLSVLFCGRSFFSPMMFSCFVLLEHNVISSDLLLIATLIVPHAGTRVDSCWNHLETALLKLCNTWNYGSRKGSFLKHYGFEESICNLQRMCLGFDLGFYVLLES